MQERLLQYIWQHQYIQSSGLTTVQGQTLEVLASGTWNHEQGPDFLHARVRIDGTLWAGQVEIHVRSSDWYKHAHEGDSFYRNIVLHVVWAHDMDHCPGALPTLQLKELVPVRLLEMYTRWMEQPQGIACAGSLSKVPELVWLEWKQMLAAERVQQKGAIIQQQVRMQGGDWEAVFWRLMFRYMGGKVNGAAFEQVFKMLGWRLIRKYALQVDLLEALLLGTGGLLNDQYGGEPQEWHQCQKLYLQLVRKHRLRVCEIPMKQLRMRPASFPFLRMRQVARLLHRVPTLFENIGRAASVKEWQEILFAGTVEEAQEGFRQRAARDPARRPLGKGLVNGLLLNVVVPMTTVYPYAHSAGRAMSWGGDQLRGLSAELHHITRIWRSLGVEVAQARDSQALLQLYESYCRPKNCLACRVGQYCLSEPTSSDRV